MDLKVTVNQTSKNINEHKQSPSPLNNLKKRAFDMELYGRAIDPLTGVEFVKKRRNQKFEFAENRIFYHNKINNEVVKNVMRKTNNKKNAKTFRAQIYENENRYIKRKKKAQLVLFIFICFVFLFCFAVAFIYLLSFLKSL
jgi:hypothetical protein